MEQQNSDSSLKESQDFLPQGLLQIIEDNLIKIVTAVVLIIFVLGGILLISNIRTKAPFKEDARVTINKHEFKVKLAKTQKEKEIGLSTTKKLPNDMGMLFPFEAPGYYPFWMRDMKFSIDIIYINKGKVVQIFSKLPAPSKDEKNLKIYQPKSPSDMVLEINSGLSEKYKIKDGDQVMVKNL